MVSRKELAGLVQQAQCFGAKIKVRQHVDKNGYFVLDSMLVLGIPGAPKCFTNELSAAESLRKFIASQPAVQAGAVQMVSYEALPRAEAVAS